MHYENVLNPKLVEGLLISCRKWLSYIYLITLRNPVYSNRRTIALYLQELTRYNYENSDIIKYDHPQLAERFDSMIVFNKVRGI
jgi:hypothetical protein